MSLDQFAKALIVDEEFARRLSELRKIRHRATEVEALAAVEPEKYSKRLRCLRVEAVFLERELDSLVGRIQRRLLGGAN